MIEKSLEYIFWLTLISIGAAIGAGLWVFVWKCFEDSQVGEIFIRWLRERKEE